MRPPQLTQIREALLQDAQAMVTGLLSCLVSISTAQALTQVCVPRAWPTASSPHGTLCQAGLTWALSQPSCFIAEFDRRPFFPFLIPAWSLWSPKPLTLTGSPSFPLPGGPGVPGEPGSPLGPAGPGLPSSPAAPWKDKWTVSGVNRCRE